MNMTDELADQKLKLAIEDLKYRNLESKIFIRSMSVVWSYLLDKGCITPENARSFTDLLTDELTNFVFNNQGK